MKDIKLEPADLNPLVPVGWFNENTELRSVSPYVATASDIWVVFDGGDIVAMALVEEDELHRLGVNSDYRRQGIASSVIDQLMWNYDKLELVCRQSLEANEFYEETGWEKVGERYGDPEDLYEWEKTNE